MPIVVSFVPLNPQSTSLGAHNQFPRLGLRHFIIRFEILLAVPLPMRVGMAARLGDFSWPCRGTLSTPQEPLGIV